MRTREQIIKDGFVDLKMYYGDPPYDGGANFCQGDGHFANSLIQKYKMSLSELAKFTGYDKKKAKYVKAKAKADKLMEL